MQDELEGIKKLAQKCLDNLIERDYNRYPYEENTIENLKNITKTLKSFCPLDLHRENGGF